MHGFFETSKVQKDRPEFGLVPKCGACGLFKTCESPKIQPYGKGERRVLVVGEAPGQIEDKRGRPFVGESGQFLRRALNRIGVDLDRDAWTTNSLICRPPRNATPDAKQISYCRPNLLNAIRQFKPRVVLTLGKSALTSVLEQYWRDVGSLERWTGWQIPIERYWICPTWHPSYLMRINNSVLDRIFSNHLEAAFALEERPPKQPEWEKEIEILYEDREVCKALREIDAEGGWAAIDYETTCIKPEWLEGRIVSCAVSNGKRTISFLWNKTIAPAVCIFLKSSKTKKIAANLKMEERWSLSYFGLGLVINWGWDTMLATHCLDNRQGICSLKFQSLVRLGVPTYNAPVEPFLTSAKGPYNRIGEILPTALLLYGGMDARFEYELAMIQKKDMGYEL